jgi:hypothetical protein
MLNCAHIESDQKGVTTSRSSVTRYAIYFTPQPGTALAAFGRSWFGRANDGATLQAFSDSGFAGTGFAKVPSVPGRYTGLHALFKAPFALRDGMGVDALKSRLVSFATRRKPAETGPLTLAREGRFLVLRPVEPTPMLDWLAAQCVAAFEDFAAPPSETERAAHASPNLSDYQRLLLESFGDPHVLSEYRFYITLTGPLDKTHLERVTQALWHVLEEICASGVTVDGLSLFGDCGGRAPLRLIGRYRLGA